MSSAKGRSDSRSGADAEHAEERPGGRERILAAAVEIVGRDGEAGLRFVDVAEQAGVAISAITHHFATREGLLNEVHARRYAGLTEIDLAGAKALAEEARDRAHLEAGISALTDAVVDAARAQVRLDRIVSLGAIHGRPDLAAEVKRTATALIDALAMTITIAQARGLVARRVEPRVLATFIQAYAVGMIVADLDETPVPRAELARFIDQLIFTVLTDPEG